MGQKLAKPADGAKPFLKPSGLYPNCEVDLKKLKRSILAHRLAPCYPGKDDESDELEECPICLLQYPALNTSLCCSKGICTECYLQVQATAARPQTCFCPFCKTGFKVAYRGPRSATERSRAKIEQQRVFEAIMKARVAEEADAQARRKSASSSRTVQPREASCSPPPAAPAPAKIPSSCSHVKSTLPLQANRARSQRTNAQRQAQFVDAQLAAYIPTDILADSSYSGDMDLNDVLLMHAVNASIHDHFSMPRESSPSEADTAESQSGPSPQRQSHKAPGSLRDEVVLLDSTLSDGQLNRLITSESSVNPILDTGVSEGGTGLSVDSTAEAGSSRPPLFDRVTITAAGDYISPTGPSTASEHPPLTSLSTVSSTSMEVLLSAAEEYRSSGAFDSLPGAFCIRDRDGGNMQQREAWPGGPLGGSGGNKGAGGNDGEVSRGQNMAMPLPPIAEMDSERCSSAVDPAPLASWARRHMQDLHSLAQPNSIALKEAFAASARAYRQADSSRPENWPTGVRVQCAAPVRLMSPESSPAVPDHRRLIQCSSLETYEAPSTPHDAAMKAAIARSDDLLRQLYSRTQEPHQRVDNTNDTAASVSHASSTSAVRAESWLERMRKQDEALTNVLNNRDAMRR
ncbi:hypothetical protein WJX73_003844 [Symbiochloris irregularis]|uniref:RING-type domain-containing protein n=1 Tax=Symbiochloris irregularis TaxID=706552 RepID=A0AAW1NYV4_9CHLO